MPTNDTGRKPVTELTAVDFRRFPVWEYAEDEEGVEGQDETWVRPVLSPVVPESSYTHVAARFTTPKGVMLAGYVTVSTLAGAADVCQGVIFHRDQGLFVSNPGAFGFAQSRAELLRALGLPEAEVFPLAFTVLVPVSGESGAVSGVLP